MLTKQCIMNSFSLPRRLSGMMQFVPELKQSVATVAISLVFISSISLSLTGCNASSANIKPNKAAIKQPVRTGEIPLTSPSANGHVVTDKSKVNNRIAPAQLSGDLLYDLLVAEFAGNSGNIQTAVNFYQRAAEKTSDPRIAARAAYIALYGKDYDETLSALNRWHKLAPKSAGVVRMYAIVYLKLHQPDKALPYIQKIFSGIKVSPKNKTLALKVLLSKEANVKDALTVLQQLNRKKEDKNSSMLVLQARYEAQLKHYTKAMTLLDDAYKSDSSMVDVLIIKARILAVQGKDKAATAQIELAVDKRPDNNVLRLQYARMLVELRKLKQAKAQYLILAHKVPDNAEILLSLALINIDTKDMDKATVQLKKLIAMHKRTMIANYYLGRIAQSSGEKKTAIAYYLRVKDDAYRFDSQIRIAVLLAELKRPDAGLKKLRALAAEQTGWESRVRVYLAEGEILNSQHRYAEGVKMYSRALKQKPADPGLLYARGLMAEKANHLGMAEADLRKVVSLEPKNANALNALGYTLADRTKRYKEALKYIKSAAALMPDAPAILDSLGWVNYRLGRMSKAEKWLAKAFGQQKDAEIAAHYGEVLWVRNKKEKAREIWREGQKINAKNAVLMETLKRLNP